MANTNNPAFLEAWKEAVAIAAAPSLFYGEGVPMATISHINKLAPKTEEIHRRIKTYSKSKAAWLATLVGFFNPEEGDKLAKKVGILGTGNLVIVLSPDRRHALNKLINSYQGW